MHWLIDDSGEVHDARSEALRTRLGLSPRPVQERSDFLVTNCGYIALRTVPHGLALKWRPTFTRRATFLAAILFLHDRQPERVLISSLHAEFADQVAGSLAHATDTLLDLFAQERATEGGHFVARPRQPATYPAASPLRRALTDALAAQLDFEPVSLWDVLERTVRGRFVVLDPLEADRKLRIRAIGSGYTNLSRRWSGQATGADFEDQPDVAYARAAAQSMWNAYLSGRPLLEDVSASMWVPSRGRTAVNYTRLILPIRVAGKPHILSASEMHPVLTASNQH